MLVLDRYFPRIYHHYLIYEEEDKTKDRQERHKITQEDFTPHCVVDSLLSGINFETISETFLDNSCGCGNILNEVLTRKLTNCSSSEDILTAVKSIYGVELMADNVCECRNKLYNTIIDHFPSVKDDSVLNYKVRAIIRNHIVWYDSLKFDYEHYWETHKPSYSPRDKHFNISFEERRKPNDDYYPMWGTDYNKQESLWK